MKIVVAIKQVPSRDSLLKVDSSAHWIDEADLSYEINEPDAYALEAGLRLKEDQGGEVVVLCVGPDRASQTIREALAKGADRAIHIDADRAFEDPLSLARVMAKALESEKPDLVLTGLQSDDLGYGQTGVVLAEVMGLPARHHHHEHRSAPAPRSRLKESSKTAGSSTSRCPAGAADHPVRRHQAPLRHPHGNQESEDVRKSNASPPPSSESLPRRLSASNASTCPRNPNARKSSTARPKKRRQRLIEKLRFEARVL